MPTRVARGRQTDLASTVRNVEQVGSWRAPAIILVAAIAIRLVVLVQLGGHPLLQPRGVLDDAAYVNLAARVAAGDLALAPDIYFLAPFYTYFLGLILALTGDSLAAARVVQVALGTAAVGLIMWTASQWFGRQAGLITGIIAACTGIFAFNEILILQSAVDPFLTALALCLLTGAVRSPSWRAFTLTGISLGALVLNRPNALPFVGCVTLLWVLSARSRASLSQAAVLLAGVAFMVGPVILRNRVVAGEWVLLTSHGGMNFYIGNGPNAGGSWQQLPGITPSVAGQARDMQRVAGEALGHPVSSNEASSYYYSIAWQWIQRHPGAWLRLLFWKAVLMLTGADVALNYSYTYFARDETSLLSLLVIGPWFVIPLGLFGLAVGARRERPYAYFTWVSFVPVYGMSVVGFFVSSRYRLAWLVPLVAGSGNALVWFWRRLRESSVSELGAPVAALSALALIVNWPLVADNGRLYQRAERILQLISDGHVEEGRRLLAQTEHTYPDKALLYYRVGLVFRNAGDSTRAASYLERSLSLSDGEPHVQLNLGEALLEVNRPADAIPHLEAARAAGIEPARIASDLAEAHSSLGQTSKAREALGAVIITPRIDGSGLLELGEAALRAEDPELAERFLRQAVVREPNLARAHRSLGVALAVRHLGGEAIEQLQQAVTLQPGDHETRFYLGVALVQNHRIKDAIEQLHSALQVQPEYPEAKELLERLLTAK